MNSFGYLSVAVSFVLGLAIAYLLSSVLSAFRERRTCRPDTIPLIWAFYIFAYQVQYWWAGFQLSGVESWGLEIFGLVLFLALLLFAAGGIVLPQDANRCTEGLWAYFERDGRWAIIVLSVYFLMIPMVNLWLPEMETVTPLNVMSVALGLLGLSSWFLRTRRAFGILTGVFGLALLGLYLLASPARQ